MDIKLKISNDENVLNNNSGEPKKTNGKSRDAQIGIAYVFCVAGFILAAGALVLAIAIHDFNGLFYANFWDFLFHGRVYGYYDGWMDIGRGLPVLRAQIMFLMWLALIGALITLVSVVYLCVFIGKKDEHGNVILKGVDKIYTEIQLLIIFAAFVGGGFLFTNFTVSAGRGVLAAGGKAYSWIGALPSGYETVALALAFAVVIGLAAAGTGLWMMLSCVRKLKARCFLKQSIVGAICIALYEALYAGGSVM